MNHAIQQDELDTAYAKFVHVYITEMKQYMKEIGSAPKSKKLFKHKLKPFWNDVLEEMWRSFHNAEKCWLKCEKSSPRYAALKQDFKSKQKSFDNELWKVEVIQQKTGIWVGTSECHNPTEIHIKAVPKKQKKHTLWGLVTRWIRGHWP